MLIVFLKVELIYLDTNIYLAYLENRTDNLRPLGEFALRLIQRTLGCEFKIIISGLVVNEVERHVNVERLKEVIRSLKETEKLIRVGITSEDEIRAKELTKTRDTHFDDALHAVLAQRAKAKFLITRNINDFADLQDLVDIRLPESI